MFPSPLTSSESISLLKVISAENLIEGWKNSFQIDITQELKGHQEICLYKCQQTQLKFFFPFDLAGSSKLYEQLQRFDWYYIPDKWEYRIALKNLSDCKQILEIGSGVGAFLRLAQAEGLQARGIELNKKAVESTHGKGLLVERRDLKEIAELYSESMDAVCSFQVLEHVSSPKDFINYSIKLLKSGGRLIYSVPNSESFLKYQYNLLDMPPHHMHQWSEETFKSLEKFYPIKLKKVLFEPLAHYHIFGYISTYANHFRNKNFLGKLLFNRYIIPVYRKSLSLGLRNLLRGQSLYAQFCKL